jgi:hypothetical protein
MATFREAPLDARHGRSYSGAKNARYDLEEKSRRST